MPCGFDVRLIGGAFARSLHWVTVLRVVWIYLIERFPLHTLGLAVLLSDIGSYLLYSHTGSAYGSVWLTIAGALTLTLLFLSLRLLDDIDDLNRDVASGRVSRGHAHGQRKAIVAGYIVVAAAIVALSWGPETLLPMVAALLMVPVVSFVVKPLLSRNADGSDLSTGNSLKDAILGLFAEGVVFLMLTCPYFFWVRATHQSIGLTTVLATTGVFWASYEIWKFSRYLTRPDWKPYRLGWRALQIYVGSMLMLSAVSQVAIWNAAGLSPFFLGVAVIVPLTCVTWLFRAEPIAATSTNVSRRLHQNFGLLYAALLDITIVAAGITLNVRS